MYSKENGPRPQELGANTRKPDQGLRPIAAVLDSWWQHHDYNEAVDTNRTAQSTHFDRQTNTSFQ